MFELENHIQTYFQICKNDATKIASFFKPFQLKKGDYFLLEGKKSEVLGFLKSGLIREFVYTNNKETTKWIATKDNFVVELSSFIFDLPSRWNLQALTDCELFIIHKKDYDSIAKEVPHWSNIEKMFIAHCFSMLEDRVMQHLSLNAEERYQLLFSQNKELFNHVPLQYLASMIGMTPETFSRIRKKQLR